MGRRPKRAATEASSADAKYTRVSIPKRFGKLRVYVDTAVEPFRIWAWLPMHSEHPGVSIRAPVRPKIP